MTILRKALLGGAALAVMATGAQADELSALKAQLEALQARVDTMESAPATSLEGKSLLTFERGAGANDWYVPPAADAANYSNDNGFTIAVTPTADMPVPVAEITVYGYVKGVVNYDFQSKEGPQPNTYHSFRIWEYRNQNSGDHISLSAHASRFGIRSKVDTAVGQIRTQIEADFWRGEGSDVIVGRDYLRLRHAVGHWDMTPNWTLSVGQTWNTGGLLPIGITTVDFTGPAGTTIDRAAQVRLTYADGPLSWAVAIENPSNDSETNMPNIASYIQYDVAGGHTLIATGVVSDWDDVASAGDDATGWVVGVGANINLADVALLTGGMYYGEGEVYNYTNMGGVDITDGQGGIGEAIGFSVGLSFAVNETTSFNVAYGRYEDLDKWSTNARNVKEAQTVHANIMWQPVSQMRLGWEVAWGDGKTYGRGGVTANCTGDCGSDDWDALRASFGAWFFF